MIVLQRVLAICLFLLSCCRITRADFLLVDLDMHKLLSFLISMLGLQGFISLVNLRFGYNMFLFFVHGGIFGIFLMLFFLHP